MSNLVVHINCVSHARFKGKGISFLSQVFRIIGELRLTPDIVKLTVTSINKPDLRRLESNIQSTKVVVIDGVSYSIA